MTNVLVVTELLDGQLRSASLSAMRFAADVTQGGGAYDVLVIGEGRI